LPEKTGMDKHPSLFCDKEQKCFITIDSRLINRINLAQTPYELWETFKDGKLGITGEDIEAFYIFCSGNALS